nr:hypothetical protein [Tanacetum cinerariifolium]
METPDNPFVAPVNIKTIEAFMNRVSYQGVVDKTCTSNQDQYSSNVHAVINQTNADYATILWIEEDYHSIKDDIPLEIHTTDDYKEYEMVFINVDVSMNHPQPVVSTQGTHRSTPRAHRTPTLTSSPQGKKRKQSVEESSSPRQSYKITIKRKKPKKLVEEEIEKTIKGDEDEESYASEFADSVLNDDVDDSSIRIEPESYKENPKNVDDDDKEIEIEKKDKEIEKNKTDEEIEKENKDDNVKKTYEVVTEKEIVNDVIRKFLDHCKKFVLDVTFEKTKEMITQEMPRLVNLAVNKDHEVDPINAKDMIAKEFVTHGKKII